MQKNDQLQLDDASDGSPDAEVSAADIISKVGEILQEFATNVRTLLRNRNTCKVGPLAALLGLFVAIPTSLFHVLLLLLTSISPSF